MAEWDEMEDELRRSLRHVPAPDGFTDRVMERVSHAQERGRDKRDRAAVLKLSVNRRAVWWTTAAATLLLTVAGGDALHLRHQRQVRQADAQRQVDLAMQLTDHALNEVELGLDRSRVGRYTQWINER